MWHPENGTHSGKKIVLSGRYHALSDCNPFPHFDVCALSHTLEPLQTSSYDPVAYRLVSDLCPECPATCTVLTPKQEENGALADVKQSENWQRGER
jgi:hypothetical protein